MADNNYDLHRQGRDNFGATTDDGSNVSPNLAITGQPKSDNTRAELSVASLNVSPPSITPLRPMHGLDFLIGVTSLLIQQTVELNDLTSSVESENWYIVRESNGPTLFLGSETSTKAQRLMCGVGRAFTMKLHDTTRQRAMDMERRLASASCCFPCRLQEMKVITPPGDYIGRVQQQWTWLVPFYLVRNVNDDVIYVIEGPARMNKGNIMQCEFKILTTDSLRQVGKIFHSWNRELVSFVTTIVFPDCAVQPKHKALLLAATFLFEYTYFERTKTSYLRCNCC